MNKKPFNRSVIALALSLNLVAVSGCGYLLYPERHGQTGSRIDPVVAAMDAGLLLFYLIPGIVAFAVDFSNGTIYIPPDGESAIDGHLGAEDNIQLLQDGWSEVPVEGEMNSESVAQALSQELDAEISAEAIELMPVTDNIVMR
ncbi:MAG: hypothetical protein RLN82_03220 [Pseudomonadales bacterium]